MPLSPVSALCRIDVIVSRHVRGGADVELGSFPESGNQTKSVCSSFEYIWGGPLLSITIRGVRDQTDHTSPESVWTAGLL